MSDDAGYFYWKQVAETIWKRYFVFPRYDSANAGYADSEPPPFLSADARDN